MGTVTGIVLLTAITSGVGAEAAGVGEMGELSEVGEIEELGEAGEAAVDGAGNTTRIPSLTDTASYRIPDILDEEGGVIGEVKNVAYQSLTSQLRDYIAYAQAEGLSFELYVRTTTVLSGPLQEAVQAGQVILKFLPW